MNKEYKYKCNKYDKKSYCWIANPLCPARNYYKIDSKQKNIICNLGIITIDWTTYITKKHLLDKDFKKASIFTMILHKMHRLNLTVGSNIMYTLEMNVTDIIKSIIGSIYK